MAASALQTAQSILHDLNHVGHKQLSVVFRKLMGSPDWRCRRQLRKECRDLVWDERGDQAASFKSGTETCGQFVDRILS